MFNEFNKTKDTILKTPMVLKPEMAICQADYPLDWYQEEFMPYAEEYQKLPDRKMSTIIPWMEKYIKPAQDYFGPELLLLAHYYMGGEIVRMIEHFGGVVGDSYQLALMAVRNPEKKVIVESAVHFMAETISLLAGEDQRVYITNPKSGCTMEMFAKDFMVKPAFEALNERYGVDNIIPICYMNTSGRLKAMTGFQNGAVCTSSNVTKIFQWALKQKKKILFVPDQHMGQNAAGWTGIPPNKIATWPGGTAGAQFNLLAQKPEVLKQFDEAQLFLFGSECSVHSYFTPAMVHYFRERHYHVVVHPECRKEVAAVADSYGSTAHIFDLVMNDRAGTKKYAVGTENHMVANLKEQAILKGIEVINLGAAEVDNFKGLGCGCATMARNDPPHLVAVLDLLRRGQKLDFNIVRPGDVVDEFSGVRERVDAQGQAWMAKYARIALENMIRITEAK